MSKLKIWAKKDIKYFKTIFEKATAGTYSVTLSAGDYLIEMYGGGGGVSGYTSSGTYVINGGGSGAGYKALVTLPSGTYSIVVGKGGTGRAIWNGSGTGDDGTASTFGSLITCGAGTKGQGTGGTVTLSSSLNVKETYKKQAGQDGARAAVYASWTQLDSGYSTYDGTHYGYGAGGWWYGEGAGTATQNGLDGYVKIESIGTKDDYTRIDETVTYKVPAKLVNRKYYKYQYSNWTQPVLTSNGVMGGDTFAVSSNVAQYSGQNVYWLMDNNTTNSFHSTQGTKTGYIDLYNPNPLNITNLLINNQNSGGAGNRASTAGKIYGSNDGGNWTLISQYTNSVQGINEKWKINLSSNTKYYKYYRIESTAGGSAQFWTIGELTITAKQQTVVDGSESNYDFYEDKIIYYAIKD